MIVVEYFSNLLFGKMIIFFTDFVFRHPLPLVRELCYIVMVMWWWWWQRQRTVQSRQTLVCSRFSFNFCIHSHTDPQSRCHGNNFISTFKKAPKQSTLWCSSETSFLWRENNNTFTCTTDRPLLKRTFTLCQTGYNSSTRPAQLREQMNHYILRISKAQLSWWSFCSVTHTVVHSYP